MSAGSSPCFLKGGKTGLSRAKHPTFSLKDPTLFAPRCHISLNLCQTLSSRDTPLLKSRMALPMEGGPKRTMLSTAMPQSVSDQRLVPVQTTSSTGRTVMTAVSLDKMSCRVDQPVPSAISSNAVLSHRPVANTTSALSLQRLQAIIGEDERRARADVAEMAEYTHSLICTNERLEHDGLRNAMIMQRLHSGGSEKGRPQPAAKQARLEESHVPSAPPPQAHQQNVLHFAFPLWRDDLSAVAASSGSTVSVEAVWWTRPLQQASTVQDRSVRTVLLEMLARPSPVKEELELRYLTEMGPCSSCAGEQEIIYAVLERSLSLLLTLHRHASSSTTCASSSNARHHSCSPPPMTNNGTVVVNTAADVAAAIGRVCATAIKVMRKYSPCGSSTLLMEAWLRCCSVVEPSNHDMHLIVWHIMQLIKAADLATVNWLRSFFLTTPPTVAAWWNSMAVYPAMLAALCGVCSQFPERLELVLASLPLVVALLSMSTIQQTIVSCGGGEGLPTGVAEAVMQFAGLVEVLQPQLVGSDSAATAAAATELIAFLQSAPSPHTAT